MYQQETKRGEAAFGFTWYVNDKLGAKRRV